MRATLIVRRYDPESGKPPYDQTYTVDVGESEVILDALIKIREEQDGSLALRCSCRSAICGSCAMNLNGHSGLACKTRVATLAPHGEPVCVGPGGNLPVIKDLVVDMGPFWAKVRQVTPWLRPGAPPPPNEEYRVPNARMLDLSGMMACIMCGACVMACTVLEAEQSQGGKPEGGFLGPAALAKALRFVGDPRDGTSRERLEALMGGGGIWDCTHCFECVQRCPKGVAPMDRILELRRRAVDAGFTDHNGVRHAQAFVDSVRKHGLLDENYIARKSVTFGELFQMMPVALRMMLAGKMPPMFPHNLPGDSREDVKRIFEAMEKEKPA